MSKNRKFTISVTVDKKVESADIELDEELLDKDIEETAGISGKDYTVKGKFKKGWFGYWIEDLKIFESTTDKTTDLKPTYACKDWVYSGPIFSLLGLAALCFGGFYWWKSSNKNEEEETEEI